MKALIKVGYGCNDHCTFCHTLDVRHVDAEAAEVHAKIERAKALGHSMVVLSGGEPTIRPELVRWAEHSHRLGMRFGLVTNGRMLRYPELVRALLDRGLGYVYLSLHGGSAKIHNLMVRSDAFDESYGALANLTGKALDLTVNCVITRHNVGHLRELVDALLPYRDAKVKMSMVEPKGGGDRLFEHLVPRVEEVGRRVLEALEYGRARATDGPRFHHGGIPLCLLPGWEHAYDDLRTHGFRTMVEVGEPDFYPVDDLNKTQPEDTCRGCSLRGACPGLYKGYFETFGAAELRPRRDGARGNSFDLHPEAMDDIPMREWTHDTCPVRTKGITPWDHARDVHVLHASKLVRFRASGRDFSDAEMTAAKRVTGQLYADISGKLATDDFARDLRPVRQVAMCASCPDEKRCSGLFTVVAEDVFTRDDQRVRDRIRNLRGDILDIGCGELRYTIELDRSDVAYTGIDPDPRRVESMLGRMPKARGIVSTVEELVDERAFDHVLVLHAWNHFERPELAASRIRRALRPHGTLLVVDDVAFGLLRSATRGRQARAAPLALEHHRLDDDGDCAAVLDAAGFEVVERVPVGPGTSNQWLLTARPKNLPGESV